jgi:hypothetical protein
MVEKIRFWSSDRDRGDRAPSCQTGPLEKLTPEVEKALENNLGRLAPDGLEKRQGQLACSVQRFVQELGLSAWKVVVHRSSGSVR